MLIIWMIKCTVRKQVDILRGKGMTKGMNTNWPMKPACYRSTFFLSGSLAHALMIALHIL